MISYGSFTVFRSRVDGHVYAFAPPRVIIGPYLDYSLACMAIDILAGK